MMLSILKIDFRCILVPTLFQLEAFQNIRGLGSSTLDPRQETLVVWIAHWEDLSSARFLLFVLDQKWFSWYEIIPGFHFPIYLCRFPCTHGVLMVAIQVTSPAGRPARWKCFTKCTCRTGTPTTRRDEFQQLQMTLWFQTRTSLNRIGKTESGRKLKNDLQINDILSLTVIKQSFNLLR
jgi:hypothetical protein